MGDDLVQRLRDEARRYAGFATNDGDSAAKLFNLAAERIEALEAALDSARVELLEAEDKFWVFCCNMRFNPVREHPDAPFAEALSKRMGAAANRVRAVRFITPAPAQEAFRPPEELGHKTRNSDSSLYDEVCTLCGATDAAGDRRLEQPCQATRQVSPSAEVPDPRDAVVEAARDLIAKWDVCGVNVISHEGRQLVATVRTLDAQKGRQP